MEPGTRQTTVWLTDGLYQWLRREAFERSVSQSQVIRDLIEAEQARRGISG